ncbi:DUF1707 SHOCT-like domain-containing protein [Nocardioides dilutus]
MSAGPFETIRIGDAERERAAADLGEHYAQGRLSADEHAERLEQVWAAKTHAELSPLFRDLPGGAYGARPAGPPPRPEPRWRTRRSPVPLFAAVPLLALVAVVMHAPFVVFAVLGLWFLARGPRRHWRHGSYGCR